MNIKKLTLKSPDFPESLHEVPLLPAYLYHAGSPLVELLAKPAITIIGTRRITPYGTKVTKQFARDLANQGVVIVSGLAFGVDATAHEAALEAGGRCIAVLPGPLDNILPTSNYYLAKAILENGGALLSEYQSGTRPGRQNFIARNRIMSGLTEVTLVTEAGKKSGTLHTAHFAMEQGKTLLAVPGDIYQSGSQGINHLLKSGALIATEPKDALHALGLEPHHTKLREVKGRNANEQKLLDLMMNGVTDGYALIEGSGLTPSEFSQALTMLELGGKIEALGGNHWAIY